jgi:hypothetical protein
MHVIEHIAIFHIKFYSKNKGSSPWLYMSQTLNRLRKYMLYEGQCRLSWLASDVIIKIKGFKDL